MSNMKQHTKYKLNNNNAEPKGKNQKVTNQTPNREEIAKAAVARAEEEEKRKNARREKAERQKEEAIRAKEEEIASMKRIAAEKAEALERKDAVKSTVVKLSAAAAAIERAEKAAPDFLSKTETQVRENTSTLIEAQHSNNCAKESADFGLYNKTKRYKDGKEEKLEAEKQAEAEANEAVDKKGAFKAVQTKAAEAALARASAAANDKHTLPNSSWINEEADHTNPSGARPKGKLGGTLIHPANNQAERNSEQQYKSSSSSQVQPNDTTSYDQEKETITVTGKKASQSRGGGDQEMSVTRHKHFVRNGLEESLKHNGDKFDIDYKDLEHKTKMNSEFKDKRQKCIQGYQNEPMLGNRGAKDSIHEGEHSYKSQEHPTQRSEGFQHNHQQSHHNEQEKWSHNHDTKRGRHNHTPYSHYSYLGSQQMSQYHGSERALTCESCNKKFNLQEKLPRNLHCGHSICAQCISKECNWYGYVSCLTCPERTWQVRNIEMFPVNQPLCEMLSRKSMQGNTTEEIQERKGLHLYDGSNRRQYNSYPGNEYMARSGMGQVRNKSIPPRSPHGSKCLETGVRPSSYCCTCKVWVCGRCADVEHSNRRCIVKSVKDQLAAMKQKNVEDVKRAEELLIKFLQSLENSIDEDTLFVIWMKTALECVEKKQESMKRELKEGRELREKLTDAIKSLPSAKNLPEALTMFQESKDITSATQQWMTDAELSATGGNQEKTACFKHLMRRTFRSLQTENGIDICAVVKLHDAELHSELRFNGGRFHLHALRRSIPTSHGVRTLPLECFKLCLAAASSLVFLDLSWGGKDRGRLYIRLTGETLRGRRFISTCIGEGGISYRGTCFQRVWWKGLPGEHVWTGDHETGDGSGRRSLSPISHEEVLPAGREVPISAGLVAGRYEKKISSIFRIYTREDKGGKDEVGFGHVEFGLDVVREALRLKNISDVMIRDCGLVLEM